MAVSPFIMVLFGVFSFMLGLLGVYVAKASIKTVGFNVLIFYQGISICMCLFLITWAAWCFVQIPKIDRDVRRNWPRIEEELYPGSSTGEMDDAYYYGSGGEGAGEGSDADEEEDDDVEASLLDKERQDATAAVMKSWLMVTGIFELLLVFFQVRSLQLYGGSTPRSNTYFF